MSLPNQPPEILIEQLRYLPLADLLNACQSNRQIAAVCERSELWYWRLQDDFEVTDFRSIPDPRVYYFDLLDKREYILNYILSTIDEDYFDDNDAWFSEAYDIDIYEEFEETQKVYVGRLNGEDIEFVYSILKVLRISKIWHPNRSGPDAADLFFFDMGGGYNFSTTDRY